MDNIIDLKKKEADKEVIISTAYYLCRSDESGKEVYREPITGDEHIKTTCPECGKEFWLDIYEFFDIASHAFCFHGTMLFCSECSAKRAKQKQ